VSARAWMDAGSQLFLGQLAGLTDDDLDQPTALPGWTRRHVVAHVHFNACALLRLASWAATGRENRMYDSPDQRAAEIEEGAGWSAASLRSSVRDSALALSAALDGLSDEAWQAKVITAQGRTVPATEVPWMRAREVMVHTLDLGSGLTFADLPAGFVTALLADVVARRAASGEGPDLATWLTGRTTTAPELGRWL
jgi:maleylpyruvate isomerase